MCYVAFGEEWRERRRFGASPLGHPQSHEDQETDFRMHQHIYGNCVNSCRPQDVHAHTISQSGYPGSTELLFVYHYQRG